MKRILFFVPVLTLLVPACSSHKALPEMRESFSTHILVNGEKNFQLALTMAQQEHKSRPGRGGGPGGPGGMGGPPPGGGMGGGPPDSAPDREGDGDRREEEIRQQITEKLNGIFQENRYCREGYDILEENLAPVHGTLFVRGRCSEAATDEDRERFASVEKPKVIYERLDEG